MLAIQLQAASSPDTLLPASMLTAATASLTRLVVASRAARHRLADRTAAA